MLVRLSRIQLILRQSCLLIGLLLLWPAESQSQETDLSNTPLESTIHVMDLVDIPALSGKVEVEGVLTSGEKFHKQAEIKEGTALIQWNNESVEGLTFTINSPGFLTLRQKFFKPKERKNLSLKPKYIFRLVEGIEIGGKVVDQDGKPIPDVNIQVYVPGQKKSNNITHLTDKQTTTDDQGRWSISGLSENFKDISLKLHKKDYRSTPRTDEVLLAQYHQLKSQTDARQLVSVQKLSKKRKLTGVIQDAQGNPVPGAMIYCSVHERKKYYEKPYPSSGEKGRFEIEYVGSGDFELNVYSLEKGYSKTNITLPNIEPLSVTLKAWQKIEFHVVDEQGNPLPGVRIESCIKPDHHPQETECCHQLRPFKYKFKLLTDKNGVAVWNQAPPEEIGFDFDKSTYSTPIKQFKPRPEPYRIVMSQIQRIKVIAIDALSMEPLSDYSVSHYFFSEAHPEGVKTPLWRYRSDDPEHSFAVFQKNQPWRCCVRAKGYRPGFSRTVPANEFKGGWLIITVPLVKKNLFRGVVLKPDGQPAEEAEIRTYSEDLSRTPPFQLGDKSHRGLEWDWAEKVTTDSNGGFQLQALDKYYIARITHPKGYALLNDAELMRRPETKLKPWVTFKGRIFSNGKPAPQAEINMHRESTYFTLFCDSTTDKKGYFNINKCIPGTWEMGFYMPTKKTFPDSRFELRCEIPDQKEVQLELAENSYSLLGKIKFVDQPDDPDLIPEEDLDELGYISIIQSKIKLPPIENPVKNLEVKLSTYLETDASFGVDQLLPYESELMLHVSDNSGHDYRSQPVKFTPQTTPEGHIYLGEIKVKLTDEYLEWD